MTPRGFAWQRASVTNPLSVAAIGPKSNQIAGLATMSFVSKEKRKDCRANNSFKPTPFRCVACVRSLRSHTSPHRSRRGLTQALCGGHKELLCAGKALLNLVPNVDSAGILARPVLDLGLRILWAEQFAGLVLSRVCVG